MKSNMGSADKFIRFMVGTALLLNIIILEPGTTGTIILLVLGLVMWASAWTGYCPAYKSLGVCTCSGTCTCAVEEAPAEKKTFELKIVRNVGNTDRFVRMLVGLAFLANIAVITPCVAGIVLLVVFGIAILASAWKGYCPIYQIFGINTCSESCGSEPKA